MYDTDASDSATSAATVRAFQILTSRRPIMEACSVGGGSVGACTVWSSGDRSAPVSVLRCSHSGASILKIRCVRPKAVQSAIPRRCRGRLRLRDEQQMVVNDPGANSDRNPDISRSPISQHTFSTPRATSGTCTHSSTV